MMNANLKAQIEKVVIDNEGLNKQIRILKQVIEENSGGLNQNQNYSLNLSERKTTKQSEYFSGQQQLGGISGDLPL